MPRRKPHRGEVPATLSGRFILAPRPVVSPKATAAKSAPSRTCERVPVDAECVLQLEPRMRC